MLKKALIIGVLGVSMFAMRGGEALAHYHGYLRINGFLRHVSSFDCGINIRGVRNLDQHQAVFKCEATITEVRVLCVNPRNNKKFKGKDVRPGSVATRIVISGETAILDEDITNKKKGLATVAVPITDRHHSAEQVLREPELGGHRSAEYQSDSKG